MSGLNATQRKVYIRTFIVWLLLAVGFYGAVILSPPDRSGELYANTWSFRTTIFLIFLLPIWTAFLGVTLFAEASYFRWKQKP